MYLRRGLAYCGLSVLCRQGVNRRYSPERGVSSIDGDDSNHNWHLAFRGKVNVVING